MQSFWIFLSIFIFGVLCQAHHAEEGKVLATFGPYAYQTQAIYSQDLANSPLLFGLGFLAEADIDAHGGIEVGLLYLDKTYQRTFGATHIVETVRKFDVPVGYRYWIFENLGVALSFSSLFSVGPYSVIYTDIVSATNGTSARNEAEYGFAASVHYEFLTVDPVVFLLDLRYFFSVSAYQAEDANQYGAMVGIKYLVHEK